MDEFDLLLYGKTVKFPILPIFIILVVVILMAPTYPTQETSYRWSAWDGYGPSVTNLDLQPPLVVLLNGFEWHDRYFFFGSIDGGISISHTASPLPMIAYLLFISTIGIYFLRRQRNNKKLIFEETNARYSLMFYGFIILATGLCMSVGLFYIIIFGDVGPLPIDGWSHLMIIFSFIAPIFLFLSFYILRQTNKLEESPVAVDDIPFFQRVIPSSIPVCIVIFVVVSFAVQASIPHTEPPSLNRSISVMSITDINITSSTSVEITFGNPYPGNSADNLEFVLSSANDEYVVSWPDSISGSNITMECHPNDITAIFQSQEYIASASINSGNKLLICNLPSNETYRIGIYNMNMDSMVSLIGQDTFALSGGA